LDGDFCHERGNLIQPFARGDELTLSVKSNAFYLMTQCFGPFNAQDRDRTIADSAEKSSDSAQGDAKSAAIDTELADLVANWPSLPAIIKSAILAVARQHSAEE
jgi:hypothetical protein